MFKIQEDVMTVDRSIAPPRARAGAAEPRPPQASRPARHPQVAEVFRPLPRTWYDATNRGLNLLAAVFLLALSAPLIGLAAVLVKLASRGPAFYTQTRMGLRGKPFTLYKVRTMYHDCERHSGAQWSRPGDRRIVPVCHLLRRLHIDEFPQLWNVVRGEMSLIGPRPERPEFLPQLERAVPRYRDRLLVLPGITGLAQVQLPADTDLADVRAKVAYDLFYIRHRGFWLDCRVAVATLFKVAGLPPPVARRLLFLPPRDTVEGAYRHHAAGATAPA
jgi:lipopolysaccharide/colanic/teichoic acid biosynthesis glycosyltransferase